MAHSHDKDDACTHHDACCKMTSSACCQTLDELDFQKGIWGAAMNGDVERLTALLSKGVSSNATDSAGYKPLHYAARNGHYEVCEILLQHGADVNATTPSIGATPLHRAVTQGHTRIIDLLLEHGANANLRDADGKTPLHRAITDVDASLLEKCKLLVPVTDLTIMDNAGRTVEESFQETVKDHSDKVRELKKMLNFMDIELMLKKEKYKNKKEQKKNVKNP